MRGAGSWEAWTALLFLIAVTVVPVLVGIGVVKLYRHFKPIQQPQLTGLAAVGTESKDGFFKKVLIGWLVCGPVYFAIYTFYLDEALNRL